MLGVIGEIEGDGKKPKDLAESSVFSGRGEICISKRLSLPGNAI